MNPNNLEEKLKDLIEAEQDINCQTFQEHCLENIHISYKKINKCEFNNVKLLNINFKNVEFFEVCFTDCDLSNTIFEECHLTRVIFKNCKLLGVNISGVSYLNNVIIDECHCKYIYFSGNEKIPMPFSNIIIKNSDLTGSRFLYIKLNETVFDNVILKYSEIFNTSFREIDLSNCQINDMKISIFDARGVIVNENQALALINLFGIVVKD